jgi:hypothetical protein
MEVDGVYEEPSLEVVKGDISNEVLDQHFEGFASIEGGREETPEGHIRPGNLEHIAPANQPGTSFHVTGRNAGCPGRRYQ